MPEIVVIKKVQVLTGSIQVPASKKSVTKRREGWWWGGLPRLWGCFVPGLLSLGVEVGSPEAEEQSEEEEQEAEESHQHPAKLSSLAVVGLADLNHLTDHVVGEEQAHVAAQNHQNWG